MSRTRKESAHRMATAIASSEEWKSSTKRETLGALEQELAKLVATTHDGPEMEMARKEMGGFLNLFSRFLRAKTQIDWKSIQPLPEGAIKPYKQLAPVADDQVASMLSKLVVIKLNGGLGTSMGCKGPKSVIAVRNDLTFLDLTMQQIQQLNRTYNVDVPLVLMNSFNTDDDTQKLLKKYANVKVSVVSFCQSRYPRINKETLMPIGKDMSSNDLEAWYPPGHGNFYEAFANSGLLDKFLEQGKEFCFLSNIDNMGATVDLSILNFVMNPTDQQERPEFVMEVTDKTSRLFQNSEYSTQTILWANLGAIKRVISNNELDMEVIVNPKHLDRGLDVIQLETAAGAAIKNFKYSCGINVPRSRSLPVKKSSDLLLLMSNLYDIDSGSLTFHINKMHTILLMQPTGKLESRTWSDYETLRECLEAICKIYEEFLKKHNPGQPSITYDVSNLFDFIDKLTDLSCMVLNKDRTYMPHNKEWIKEKIFAMLKNQASVQ
ncbi:unnamed protein product, partial [Mesorhabditis spiculigera]